MTIEKRLENWARAQSSSCAGVGTGSGLVASIYFPSVRGQSVDSTLDLADAERVELAIRKLMPMDRKLLQMLYIWRKPPFLICRRLGLKVRPAEIFDFAVTHAKRALDEKLMEPRREYVSMRSVIERLSEGVAQTK
ncbi:conserved hypothetical protein [Burkholderia latens]|uniref:hypothetical protein n=1 Tax=Burkholderia latens TaxID=488446 RepID=UPI0039A4236F